MANAIAFEIELAVGYEEALQRVIEALSKEGFGVLSRIDIQKAFKEKIDVDFRPYTILGACNPQLAHKALSARPDAGMLLPCNVTVEASDDGVTVRIIDPAEMMSVGGMETDATLAEVGRDAHDRLERVARAVGGS